MAFFCRHIFNFILFLRKSGLLLRNLPYLRQSFKILLHKNSSITFAGLDVIWLPFVSRNLLNKVTAAVSVSASIILTFHADISPLPCLAIHTHWARMSAKDITITTRNPAELCAFHQEGSVFTQQARTSLCGVWMWTQEEYAGRSNQHTRKWYVCSQWCTDQTVPGKNNVSMCRAEGCFAWDIHICFFWSWQMKKPVILKMCNQMIAHCSFTIRHVYIVYVFREHGVGAITEVETQPTSWK